ncbi:hypothetical protein LTR64_003824 [Lithohypha guttulata]|uniref:uncharacterized protein n=1 Tax=Lithohypha guttulata TaxID=1690604 RepID=UPI002DE03AF3|nr:hypothetical protein LTR51_006862 [Lithohypha guttulata]
MAIAGGRLSRFSMDPPTGFKRDGYCKVTDDDKGNHSIAATMSESFLKFTNGRGNNLESAGVKPGMRWCLCASRWKEAYDAFKDGKLEKEAVPQVHLHCTDKKALDVVTYKDLKGFAAAPEATREGGRQGVTIDPAKPSQPHGEGEMSGTRPTQDQQYGTTKEMSGGTTGAGAEQARRQTGRGG